MSTLNNRRRWTWTFVGAAAFFAAGGALGEPNRGGTAQNASPAVPTDRVAAPVRQGPTAKEKLRVREGLELTDRIGTFELSGDRARFVAADDGVSLIGLENLSLERVIHAIRDNPQQGQSWKVSGVVTEFEGRNYLLITRAILAARPK
jgi:hypothetical protein